MTAEAVANQHYLDRRELSDAVGDLAEQTWRRIDPADLDRSWQVAAPELLVGLTGAQLAAARAADGYADEVLEEQGLAAEAAGSVRAGTLAGVASDGRPLVSLLLNAIITTKIGIAGGATVDQAMAAGYANLDMLVRTQLADAGRAADQIAIATRPAVTGYVRMLVGKSCSRCVVLAGRRYGWSAGFRRHPRLPMRLHPRPGR